MKDGPIGREARRARPGSRAALLLLPLLLAACRPGPVDPVGLRPLPAPFERTPYLQAVDTVSARVLWRVRVGAVDGLRYREEAGEWRAAEVRRSPGGDRVAWLEALVPGARAEYEVWADGVTLGPIPFTTAPRPAEAYPIRVLAFGDSGYGSEAQLRLAALMEDREWDLIVHMGDLAYDRGTDAEFTRRHFLVYRELLARTPLFPVPGNHDLEADGGRSYDAAFAWPAPLPGARWYAFRWGGVLFIALDTSSETEEVAGLREGRGRQYDWLAATLAGTDGDPATAWTVVWSHAPLYSHAVGMSGHGADADLRRSLAPLFEAHGVDLVLAGHDHHYERTHPVREGRPVADGCGPVYVLTGGGGATRFARDIGASPIAARTSREHHFVSLRITGRAMEGESVGTDGAPLDEFVILPYEPAAGECG